MNWEAVGAVGEIVAAIGVVASLVFLATQIRHISGQVEQQIRSIELQAYDTASQNFTNIRLTIASDTQLALAWQKGKDSFESLAEREQAQIHELFSELFWVYENMLHRRVKGAVEVELWQLVEENLKYWLGYPGIREWWQRGVRTPHTPEFESLVERIIKDEYQGDA